MRDCDGDGILDPYCTGGQLLRFGFISSKNGCKDNWPNGLCEQGAASALSTMPPASTDKHAASNEVTLVHFNDVYTVSGILKDGRRSGGMSRAYRVVEHERKRNPNRTFVVFAGDGLSPSVLSNMFEGKQMIDILNAFEIDAATLGNHEFDFGVDVLHKRIKESKFPWLNINLEDGEGNLIPHTVPRMIKTIPWAPRWDPTKVKNIKVCFFGLSYDVRESLSQDVERMGYRPSIPEAKKEAEHLRKNEKCDVVVALTHQFEADDCVLSKELGESVDLILGGHDHSTTFTSVCGNAPIAKGAADLATQWVITMWLSEEGKVESVDGRIESLTDADPFNIDMHAKIVDWEEQAEAELGVTIGCFGVDVDARATPLRTGETNSGAFVADATRVSAGTDVAFINSGAVRGKIIKKGDVTKRTMMNMDPFGSNIAKIYASGKDIKNFINNQLTCLSDPCGDLNQISGLRYEFDSSKKPHERLVKVTTNDGKELEDDAELTVAMSLFQLNNSPLKNNKLFNMVTMNDAGPLLPALIAAVRKGGDDCVSPKTDGRVKDVCTEGCVDLDPDA